MTNLTINIITIIAEVLLVFIFFFLVNWCFGKMSRKIFQIPFMENFSKDFSLSSIRRRVRNCIFFFNFVLSSMIIGINGYLVYHGKNVREYSLQLFLKIPREVWHDLGLGIIESIGVIIGAGLALRIFNPLLDKLSQYVQDFDEISDNDKSIASFFEALKKNINSTSWIAISILCAQFLILPPVVSKYLYILLRIYLIISIGLLLFKVVAVIIDSLDALSVKNSSPDNVLRFYDKLRHLISFLKRCLEYITYVFMATLCIQQIDFIANLAVWGASGIKLISILLISRILISVAYLVVEEFLLSSDSLTNAQRQRRQTITPLIQSSTKYIIYFGSGVLMLDSIGVDPGPILAGAGILGLAVGLGAQNLINDIVSGFLILFENYYLVGDYIETEEASGYVEAIELRTTRIRNYLGQVYIVRNGDINSITNFSKGFIYANVEVGVDYSTDLDLVQDIIEKAGHQLQEECDDILEPTQVEGIEEFGDIRLSIYTITKVKPGKHVQIKRIVRQVLKEAFDREGIYIPIGETSDKPNWASKTQQKKGKRNRNSNRKSQQKRIINDHYSTMQLPQAGGKQQNNYQLEEKATAKKDFDKSIEETAQIIRSTSEQTIISQPEERPIFEQSAPETSNSQKLNQVTIHHLEANSTASESAREKPRLQNENQESKQSKGGIAKQLKNNLKKFLEDN